jgi:hypothetical protein
LLHLSNLVSRISNPLGSNLLLKLPGELRNEVYRHVFARCDLDGQPPNAFGLLPTCRQIYFEKRLMSYPIISAKVAGDVSSWLLRRSPAQCAALKTIEFDCRSTTYPTNPALRFACWLFDNVASVKLQGLETIVMLLEAEQTNTMFWHYKANKEHIEVLMIGVEVKFEYPAGHD